MTILINNPVWQTEVFALFFVFILAVLIRWKKSSGFFTIYLTQELKGLAILAVIFSHLGYFLAADHRFLFPLSIAAGVGVNLFLFLSGLGLTVGLLKRKMTVGQFYKRRLLKIFIPFWLVIGTFYFFDFLFLKITYPIPFIIKSFFGIFTTADLFHDPDSPLWYITLILFYYLVFPLVFSKRRPWLSAGIIYVISYFIIKSDPLWLQNVIHLYRVHILAFPLGMIFGWLFYEPYLFGNFSWESLESHLENFRWLSWFKKPNIFRRWFKKIDFVGYLALMMFLIIIAGYFAYYSAIGQSQEQLVSIVTVLAIIFVFILKKIEFQLLYIFGFYSYEIYLLHWPLVYRYDVLYKNLPAWLATIFYLAVCLGLGWGLKKITEKILKKI
jgi:peptidoglycan/LPS O-acetylase OafA/YrhL